MPAIKVTKYDRVISSLVRESADWKCQKCGVVSEQGRSTGKDPSIHCSHYNGRGTGNISRHDTDLLLALCGSCHAFIEHRPGEHTRLMVSIVGDPFLEERERLHRQPYKWKPGEKEEMYQHYKSELARVRRLRLEGKTGMIKIVSWW